jgi:hypothetical protein
MYDRDEHAFNFRYHFIYVIDDYMPGSLNDEYGMVGVRDKWINYAIKFRKFLVVVSSKGSQQFNAKMIKKEYKSKLFDQEGKFPGCPMHLYPLMIPNNGKTDLDQWRQA